MAGKKEGKNKSVCERAKAGQLVYNKNHKEWYNAIVSTFSIVGIILSAGEAVLVADETKMESMLSRRQRSSDLELIKICEVFCVEIHATVLILFFFFCLIQFVN